MQEQANQISIVPEAFGTGTGYLADGFFIP